MYPSAESVLRIVCVTPRPQVGEHPRTYKFRLVMAVVNCESRRRGWQQRDARLERLFTGEGDGG